MLDCELDIAMTDTRQRPMGPPAGSPIAVDALPRCVACGSDAGPGDEAAHALAA
jgi:hypothetical protein